MRRGEYYRNLKERIDELEKVDNELEATQSQLDDEQENQDPRAEREEEGEGEERTSISAGFDYYLSPIGYYPDSYNEVGGAIKLCR